MNSNARELTAKAYNDLLSRFVSWAQNKDDIRSAMVIGSRAHADPLADEFSDLDLSVFVTDPQPYLDNPDWLEHIGHPWLTFVQPTRNGQYLERRCLFEGGLEVDFGFVPSEQVREMVNYGPSPSESSAFNRGYKIIFDKDQLLHLVDFGAEKKASKMNVNEKEFFDLVNDFWYHAVWTAKHLLRGELWRAKECCDGHMKYLLYRMLEWRAQATIEQQNDDKGYKRSFEEWVEPPILLSLKTVFASYDFEDVWRALLETTNVFEKLSSEAKRRLEFSYPEIGVLETKKFLWRLYQQRK